MVGGCICTYICISIDVGTRSYVHIRMCSHCSTCCSVLKCSTQMWCACSEVSLTTSSMWLSCVQTSQEAKLNHSHLCYQDTPKRISFPSDCKILGLTAHRYGVFAVVSSGNILRVGRVDMLTGKVSDGGKFPDTQAQHFAKQQSCTLHKLVCPRIVAQWSHIVAQWP